MVKRCILTFGTSIDTRRTMSIAEPQPDLTGEKVFGAASQIIGARLHDESVGHLTNLERADIVSTDTIVLF